MASYMPNTPLHNHGNGNYSAFAAPSPSVPGFASPHHGHGHTRTVSISTPLHAPPPTSFSSSSASIHGGGHMQAHGHAHHGGTISPVAQPAVAPPPQPAVQPGTRGPCPCENAESGCLITSWMDPHHQFMYTHPKRIGMTNLCLQRLIIHIFMRNIIEEARQERVYGCARGSLGRCTAGVSCQIRLYDDHHAWRFDHKPPVVAIPATTVNTTPTPAVVVDDDTDRPICYDIPCDDTSAPHMRAHRHLCADGRGCALLPHHNGFIHVEPCKDNHQCEAFQYLHDDEGAQRHVFECTHPCELGDKCTIPTTDRDHHLRSTHPCGRGAICSRQNDATHMTFFTHPCPNGDECKELTSLAHIGKYHPTEQLLAIGAVSRSLSSASSSKSAASSKSVVASSSKTETKKGPVCSDDGKCWQQFSLVDSERCKKHHPSGEVIDVTITDKPNFVNPITDKKLSPDMAVTVIADGTTGELKGLQINDSDKCETTGKLVVGFPDPSAASKYKLAAYDISELKFTSTVLNPPWHHSDVRCFRARRKTHKLRVMLQEDVPGLNGVTYLEFFAELMKNGMPAYIIGGAVRDVLQDTKTKDIDMGFGCSTRTIGQYALNRGWDVKITGSGLIKLGDPSLALYLEGKPMNFMNNDTNKFDSGSVRSIGCSFHAENIYGDFTINRLWYDAINDVIWDPTGWGVHDCLASPSLLRVPVSITTLGDRWASGNPTKLIRYWKMIGRGCKPCDDATKAFFIAKMKEYVGNNKLSASAIGYFIGNTSATDKAAMKTAMTTDLGADFVATHFKALG